MSGRMECAGVMFEEWGYAPLSLAGRDGVSIQSAVQHEQPHEVRRATALMTFVTRETAMVPKEEPRGRASLRAPHRGFWRL